MRADVHDLRRVRNGWWCFAVAVDPPEARTGVMTALIQGIPLTEREWDSSTDTWTVSMSQRNYRRLCALFTNFAGMAATLNPQGNLFDER